MKTTRQWLIAEVGWFLAGFSAGLASTHVPFDGDYWSQKKLQRRTDREFGELVAGLNERRVPRRGFR